MDIIRTRQYKTETTSDTIYVYLSSTIRIRIKTLLQGFEVGCSTIYFELVPINLHPYMREIVKGKKFLLRFSNTLFYFIFELKLIDLLSFLCR